MPLNTLNENNLQNRYLESIIYYFVVVDAGSSGSRLRLYSCMKTSDNLISSLKEEYSNTVSLGLQNVLEDFIPQYMDKLFTGLNNTLDNLGLNNIEQQGIPVRFYATAGMRTVSPVVQNRTYHIVTDWISENTAFTDIEAKTIPGESEALYNWLAVNYLNDAFANDLPTAAAFDLGGGSSEIAYTTTDTQGSNVFQITIANKTHLVASLPWFTGNDWARNQYLDHAACFPPDYPMPDLRSYPGTFQDCQITVETPFITNPNLHPMVLSVSYIPQDVYLISTFYYAYDFFVDPNTPITSSVNFNLTAFESGAEEFCTTSWNTLMTESPYNHDDYSNTYCFASALIGSIYKNTQLEKLSEDHDLLVTKKINGTSVGWTIGVVAQEMTGAEFIQLPASNPTSAPTFSPTPISAPNQASNELSSSVIIGCAVGGFIFLLAGILALRNSKYVSESLKSCCSTLWRNQNNMKRPLINDQNNSRSFI